MADGIKILQSVFGPRDLTPDIQIDGERCVARLHRRSRCRLCADMCPAGAISIDDHVVEVDRDACTHCGACVTVCPTQAAESTWLPWKELVSGALRAVEASDGEPILSCEHVADDIIPALRRNACVMPCLERVDEALLLSMAAAGAKRIALAPGDCSSCGIGCRGAAWSLVVEHVEGLLRAVGSEVEIVIDTTLLQPDAHAGDTAISRRDALTGIGGDAARTAANVVEELVRESRYGELAGALGLFGGDSLIETASRGQVCAWALGALALRCAGDARSAIDRLGESRVPTRVFGEPVIDLQACSNCFLCTAYCHEDAIEKLKDGSKVRGFRILPHRCNGCGMCVDVCRPDALRIDHHVKLADVLREAPIDIRYEDWK